MSLYNYFFFQFNASEFLPTMAKSLEGGGYKPQSISFPLATLIGIILQHVTIA